MTKEDDRASEIEMEQIIAIAGNVVKAVGTGIGSALKAGYGIYRAKQQVKQAGSLSAEERENLLDSLELIARRDTQQ